jgi:hypothetical protein
MNYFERIYRYLVLSLIFISTASQGQITEQEFKIELRSVAHEFLLQLNDSTSRIMPIQKIGNRYEITFERNFNFEPDFLLYAMYQVYNKKELGTPVVVEVETCDSNLLVHSFLFDDQKKKGDQPCRLRGLPNDCYRFYFTPINNLIIKEADTKTPFASWILIGMVVLVGSSAFLRKRSKREDFPIVKSEDNSITIGLYTFNKNNLILSFENSSNELSSKEADLLLLFYNQKGETITRETILKEVWGDNGTYLGRSLDVYISKLRKKLDQDPNIKIMNIRGVGYRFVEE